MNEGLWTELRRVLEIVEREEDGVVRLVFRVTDTGRELWGIRIDACQV